jgi:D-glycero-D-manno-heptose 1,7-bisphosphate phosphatase
VIDVDEGHVHRREGFDFIDGIFGRCRAFQRRRALLVVTNRDRIGRRILCRTRLFDRLD